MYIGIFMRNDVSTSNHKILQLHQEFIDVLNNYDVIILPICLNSNPKNVLKLINLSNGVIIPGGDELDDLSIKYIKYLYDIDKPTLGICLGMQEMSYAFNGILDIISNHNSKNKYVHDVYLSDSILTKIFKTNIIKVNSRHNYQVIKTDLKVIGVCNNIEAVEISDKKFMVGVEWHPESMYNYDYYQKLLFDHFIKIAGGNNEFK